MVADNVHIHFATFLVFGTYKAEDNLNILIP